MSVVFKSYRKEVENATEQAIQRALETVGGMAESDVKVQITKNRSVVTGNLRNSITHQQYDNNTEVVGTNVEYAPYVELGHHTRSGSFVSAKPYMRPAIENNKQKYQKVIQAELAKIGK